MTRFEEGSPDLQAGLQRDGRSTALVLRAAVVALVAAAAVAVVCAVALVAVVAATVAGDSPEGARIPRHFPVFARVRPAHASRQRRLLGLAR